MKKQLLFAALCALALTACQKQPAVMNNPAIDNIMTRVSVREFTGEKISDQQIDTLLRAAMAAPSAINKQPWAFIVVTDDELIAKLGEALPYGKVEVIPTSE